MYIYTVYMYGDTYISLLLPSLSSFKYLILCSLDRKPHYSSSFFVYIKENANICDIIPLAQKSAYCIFSFAIWLFPVTIHLCPAFLWVPHQVPFDSYVVFKAVHAPAPSASGTVAGCTHQLSHNAASFCPEPPFPFPPCPLSTHQPRNLTSQTKLFCLLEGGAGSDHKHSSVNICLLAQMVWVLPFRRLSICHPCMQTPPATNEQCLNKCTESGDGTV